VAVRAPLTQDVALLTPLLVTKAELKSLGIPTAAEKRIAGALAEPAPKKKKTATGSKTIKSNNKWGGFAGTNPSLIPADQLKTKNDIMVYERVMAFVQSGNDSGLVQIGELVRIGDTWKMTALPVPLEGQQLETISAWGAIMDPGSGPTAPAIA